MARAKPLTARGVETIKAPGGQADGGNLYLNVTASGARSWVFMWAKGGRTREMGLGSARDVSLVQAREAAAGHRATLAAIPSKRAVNSNPNTELQPEANAAMIARLRGIQRTTIKISAIAASGMTATGAR